VSVVANVAINVDSSGAVSKLRQVNDAGSKLEQTFKGVDGKLRDASGRFIKLGDSAQASAGKINVLGRAVSNLAASLAVADAARRYFKGFNEAEKAAAAVRTLGVDSKALEGNLLGLSQKLGGLFSQTQLLTAAYDVASSGFANAADNTKVLEAAAKGATGGLSDIGTVGNAVTSVLNAYGKSADEAASLVDGFIQTQNDGKIILNEYAGYIGKLAPTAKAAGVGINEMNAAIATITAQGVPVEATFTGLNQALVSILKPSKEAEELAKSLGIQFNEAGLRAKGFGGLLEEVKTKTGGSTTQLVKLFGSVDALKAILPLVNDDLVKYNQNVVKQANASGVAEKATEELGGTVSSEITKMINQIGNLVRSLDTVLGPALGGIVRLINFVIAEATKGIQVLGQLFSMSPGKKIAFEAVQSGNLGAAARVLPGIDETIGEKRRKQLQQQAGAGTGFMGMGMDQSKFIKLLQQQPEFKVPATAGNKPAAVVDPALQALLDKLASGGGGRASGGGSKAANEAKRAADEAAREAQRVADVVRDQQFITKQKGIQTKFAQLIFDAEQSADPIRARQLQTVEALVLAGNETARLLEEEENSAARLAIARTRQGEAEAIRQQGLQDVLKLQIEQQKNFDEIIAGLDLELALKTATTEQAREQLRLEAEIAKIRGDKSLTPEQQESIIGRKTELARPKTDRERLQGAADGVKEELDKLTDPINMITNAAAGIGDAFATSFKGVISGSMTAKQALSLFFSSVADMFLDMAAQIIAKMIQMFILQQALKIFGGAAGGGGGGFGGGGFGGSNGFSTFDAGGATAFSMPSLMAEGGFVTGPTNAVIGEGGESEYVIPASKMNAAMSRYGRGARGEGVIAGNGTTSEGGAPAAAGPVAIDVRYSVERINNVEYVTASQFQEGMRQAAQQGAAQGEQRTLRRLQQSPSTRKRVGV
jgi:TP901 family phage tail tape measure protein